MFTERTTSSDPAVLAAAPPCEPPLEHRVPEQYSIRLPRRAGRATAPPGLRRALRGSCRQAPPSVDSGSAPTSSGPARSAGAGGSATRASWSTAGNGSAVARFGEQVLRLAMEVVDGRRPAAQLRPVADARALEAIRTMVGRGPGRELGAAAGIRMHRPHADDLGAELFATYRRGPRYFALAARVERVSDGWRLTAFRLC